MSGSTLKQYAEKIPEISHCYRLGLQALENNSRFVRVEEPRNITGSIDLDECSSIPNPPQFPKRWDYVLGYKTYVLALEVHNLGGTNNAKEIVEKATWLRDWIRKNNNALSIHRTFFVVSPGGRVDASANKILAQRGLISCGGLFDVDSQLKKIEAYFS